MMYAVLDQNSRLVFAGYGILPVIIWVVMFAETGKVFGTFANEGHIASKTALMHKAPL